MKIDDLNKPLDLFKVEQALNSELMKLEYRKLYKPKDVSILDYTIIEALKKQISKKIIINTDGCYPMCPRCNTIPKCEYKFCPECGQRLDW